MLPLRELRRRPSRFAVATVVLAFLATLLMFLGGLLDGLFLGSTGAIRAQQADAIVFSADARDSFLRSRIDADLRAEVDDIAAVGESGGLGFVLLGAVVEGIKRLPDTRLEKLPRMADFALWATACETALWPAGTFWSARRLPQT